MNQLSLGEEFAPTVSICIPPALENEAKLLASQDPPVHPVWAKARRRGRHFIILTDSLDDITEIADYARVGIEEPELPLSKIQRQAFQILLDRAFRYAELTPMGHCHCIAVKWRDQPLKTNKATAMAMKALRRKG
jgi:hypothetical protein